MWIFIIKTWTIIAKSEIIEGKTCGTTPVGVSISFLEQIHGGGMEMAGAPWTQQIH